MAAEVRAPKWARNTAVALDVIAWVYFVACAFLVFGPGQYVDQTLVQAMLANRLISPLIGGCWLLGVITIVHAACFRGALGRVLMWIPYAAVFVLSLINLMGVYRLLDLWIYIPDAVIVAVYVLVVVRQHRSERSGM